ncbi:hypothetical protein [Vibrio barjaei]|uniref:hypothetical protein n=1 Tax=Vibrio barjaei TaxID=1676683 RepID=UPI0022832FCD|nr:hypothetical protein [Vibrio barjaei]MCY9872966.1 hypothetical protein [Vibrio barjaei]
MPTNPLRKSLGEKPFATLSERDYESLNSCNMLKFFYPFTKGHSYVDDLTTYHALLSLRDIEQEGYLDEPEIRKEIAYIFAFSRDNKPLEPLRVHTRVNLDLLDDNQLAEFITGLGLPNPFDSCTAYRESYIMNLAE